MANLYKPRYTKVDPKTGERKTRVVRKWYGRYEDENGSLKQIPLCEDKQAAQAMLTEIVRQIDRIRAGIVDPLIKHLSANVSDHISDYNSHLTAKGRSDSHITETKRLIGNVVRECRIRLLSELQAADDQIEHYIVGRLDSGVSHRTVNADIAAVRAFCRWLIKRNRMMRDPTTALEPLNVEEDRRLQRRALNDKEAENLIATAYSSKKVFRRLTGEDRAMLYLLSQRTGLRRRELKLLTPSAFDFSQSPVIVTVEVGHSKRRRLDRLPLPGDVGQAFQGYLADKSPSEPIWQGSWWRKSAEMIRLDLEDAGIPIEDSQGRVIDFHGQRTTFITNLSRAGLSPALAQKLARHSDVKLTMGTYTQMEMTELGSAVSKLRRLSPMPENTPTHSQGVDVEYQSKEVLEAWHKLSEEVRQKILETVRAALDIGT